MLAGATLRLLFVKPVVLSRILLGDYATLEALTSLTSLRTQPSHSCSETGPQPEGRSSVASAWTAPRVLLLWLRIATILGCRAVLKAPITSETPSSSGLTTITSTFKFKSRARESV